MHFRFPLGPTLGRNLTVLASVLMFLSPARAQKPSADDKDRSPVPASSSASPSAGFLTSMDSLNDSHKLIPGDQLSLRVLEEEEPPRTLIVTDSGEMEVPLLGRVKASGKTCRSLAQELKTAFQKEYFYQATVIVGLDVIARTSASAISRGRYFVMGQVRSQGQQELPADEGFTVSAAVLRAGGFSEYANKRKVKVVRRGDGPGGKTELIVDLAEVMEKGRGSDPIVRPDDVIIVPEKFFSF